MNISQAFGSLTKIVKLWLENFSVQLIQLCYSQLTDTDHEIKTLFVAEILLSLLGCLKGTLQFDFVLVLPVVLGLVLDHWSL